MRNIRLVPPKRTFVDTPARSALDMLLGMLAVLAPWALAVYVHNLASHKERDMLIIVLLCVGAFVVILAAAMAGAQSEENSNE